MPEPVILGSAEETELSPQEMLQRLQDAAAGDASRRRLVIEAEAMKFEAAQVVELNALLRSFIEEYRDSDDPQDIVAVGSAIRKYVATMPLDDLPGVASLLDAGHKAQVPLGLELEICKMVFRKLAANPPGEESDFPELEWCLTDVVRVYDNDRLLSREKYGAIALNAVLALVLLNGERTSGIAQQLRGLKAAWFRELAARQARNTSRELSQRFPDGRASQSAANLERLAVELEQNIGEGNAGTTPPR
jgi:hypothetical protein